MKVAKIGNFSCFVVYHLWQMTHFLVLEFLAPAENSALVHSVIYWQTCYWQKLVPNNIYVPCVISVFWWSVACIELQRPVFSHMFTCFFSPFLVTHTTLILIFRRKPCSKMSSLPKKLQTYLQCAKPGIFSSD